MRFLVIFVLLASLAGCGPLFVPMTPRLSPEDQKKVDDMWDNVLTPVNRVDHQTLLDANIAYFMFAIGVDRMHVTSEKFFASGKAVMEMDCDRANPDADQYTITVYDDRGRTVRRERYTRVEVEESSQMLRGLANIGPAELGAVHVEVQASATIGQPLTRPATNPSMRPDTNPATQPATAPATEPTACQLTSEQERFLKESARRSAAAAAATQPARLAAPK